MKYTLIIDGHNFLFKTLYVLPQKKNKLLLDDKDSQELFLSKLSQNLNAVLRDMKNIINRCVFVADSHSWRKDLGGGVKYKENRTQEELINWKGWEGCVLKFMDELAKYNIVYSKTPSAEADDMIFSWVNHLSLHSTPTIMYTSDKDMLQLVRRNNDVYNLLYSDVTKKLYVPKGFLDSNKPVSLFDNLNITPTDYDTFTQISYLVKKRDLEIVEVDADVCLYRKIITGDKSDNISSIYSYEKNGRVYNVTEKKADLIIEQFKENVGDLNQELLFNEDSLRTLSSITSSIVSKNENENIIFDNLKRNTKYIALSTKTLPPELISLMEANVRRGDAEMQFIDFSKISDKEPIIKRTERVFSSKETEDLSFIKDKNKKLF